MEGLIPHPFGRERVLHQPLAGLVDLKMLVVAQDPHLASPGAGHPVVVALEGDVSVFINAALQELVRCGQVRG